MLSHQGTKGGKPHLHTKSTKGQLWANRTKYKPQMWKRSLIKFPSCVKISSTTTAQFIIAQCMHAHATCHVVVSTVGPASFGAEKVRKLGDEGLLQNMQHCKCTGSVPRDQFLQSQPPRRDQFS